MGRRDLCNVPGVVRRTASEQVPDYAPYRDSPRSFRRSPGEVPPHTPNSVSSGLRRANSRHSALHLTTGADGSCLVGQSPLTPSTEEEPVRLHDLKLGTRSEQHSVNVERRGRGGVVSLASI
jgi:hypothetical protein